MMKKQAKQESKLKEDGKQYSPKELFDLFQEDRNIKIVDSEIPFEQQCYLYDISLSCKGFEEDSFYALNKPYRNYVRRGNTIFQKNTQYQIGRKGLIKFFDLKQDYIEANLAIQTEQYKYNFSSEDKQLKNIIFEEAQEALSQGYEIELFQLVKANGENCQISYIDIVDCWLISSKNVSLLAKTANDLEKYQKDRFHFAKLIAQVWFELLKAIEEKNPNAIAELKQKLMNHTLIGEYCGNQEYQHLVRYNKIDLHFFALVDKNSQRSCIPPDETYQFFQQYELTAVQKNNIGTFKDFKQFNEALLQLFNKVAESNIDDDQEGSVLYIMKKGKNEPSEILSLCKLKTLEYRIFRKLREKLKNFITSKKNSKKKQVSGDTQYLFKKFQDEVKGLCQNNKTPYPLDYYFEVARAALTYVEKYPSNSGFVNDCYINFLTVILNCLSQHIQPEPKLFSEQEVSKLQIQSWDSLAKKILEQKQIQVPQQNQQQIQQQSQQEETKSDIQNQNEKQKTQTKSGPKTLFALYFIGIPGMGKTFIQKAFETRCQLNSFDFYSVSSDQIRKDQMDELKKKKKDLSEQALFDQTAKSAPKEFDRQVTKIVSNLMHSKNDVIFLFLDKNILPNNIEKHQNLVQQSCPLQIKLLNVAVLPLCLTAFEYKANKYPFSLNFIFNCMMRIFNRENHQNLQGKSAKSLQICLFFLKMYRNITLNEPTLKHMNFNEVINMPFVYEDLASEAQFSEEFINKFINVLSQFKANEKLDDQLILQEFLEEVEKQNFQFQFVPQETIDSHLERAFNQILKSIGYQQNKQNVQSYEQFYQQMDLEENKEQTEPIAVQNQQQNNSNNNQKQEIYNPQTLPLYLGIFLKEELKESARFEIKDFVQSGLFYLSTVFENDAKIKDDYQNFDKIFKAPDSIHLTTCFIGNNKQKRKSEFFTSFKENLEMIINITAFAYVPNKIITGICFMCEDNQNEQQIKIENTFPHITLFLGSYKAKQSNDVLEGLFRKSDGPMKKQYNKQYFVEQKQVAEKFQIKIDKKEETVYVIKFGDELIFDCITKAYY